jgi:RimJ/RimL family protein N-acetyltransferase
MHLLMRHAMDDLGYRRLVWKCNALNAPSRAAALRLGFVFEGVLRAHMVVKGAGATPPSIRSWRRNGRPAAAAIAAWLADANWDHGGRRRR